MQLHNVARRSSPVSPWLSTQPAASPEMSVLIMNGLVKSGYYKIGAITNSSLRVWKAFCCGSFQ
jgi:hypothetical protein